MNFLKLSFLTIFSSFILIIYGCAEENLQSADLVFKNGFVFTVDSLSSKAEAVSVKDGKIILLVTMMRSKNLLERKLKS
jgi:hypothetical protein